MTTKFSNTELSKMAGGYQPQPGEEFFYMDAQIQPRVNAFLVPHKLDFTATKPTPAAPTHNGKPFFERTPRGDHLGDDNQPAYASLHSVANAAQCTDFGFAQDAEKSLAPDTLLRGVAAWKVGDSANNAAAKLAKLWSSHQAKNQPKQASVGKRL
jgi:hypothetical protein